MCWSAATKPHPPAVGQTFKEMQANLHNLDVGKGTFTSENYSSNDVSGRPWQMSSRKHVRETQKNRLTGPWV